MSAAGVDPAGGAYSVPPKLP